MQREFEDYLKCGRLEHGFLRVRCTDCHAEKLVAFSCKRRGFCPSCGARRMVEGAALLIDDVLPEAPMRQWVLSVPFALRLLFASNSATMGEALRIVYRTISGFMIHKAGLTQDKAQCGAVTMIQRFGSALNLNVPPLSCGRTRANVKEAPAFRSGDSLVDTEAASWEMQTVLRGANERLIPILMTATVTALGLAPLAYSMRHPGQEIEGPMAVGLVSSTILNLLGPAGLGGPIQSTTIRSRVVPPLSPGNPPPRRLSMGADAIM